MNDEEVQKRYMEYQLLDEKIKQLQQQIQITEQQLMEIISTVQSLDEFSKIEDKTEILVPLNNGIFARANLKKEGVLLVNVGSNIVVDKSIDETKKLIEIQKGKIEAAHDKMAMSMQKLVARAGAIEKYLSETLKE